MKNIITYSIGVLLVAGVCQTVNGAEKKTESKAAKLKRAVGQGTGVMDIKDNGGIVERVTFVGQARISTVLGVSKGLITAKKRASALADAAFIEWVGKAVHTATQVGDSTILVLKGAKGPSIDALEEKGASVEITQQNVATFSQGILRGGVSAAFDQDGKSKLYTIVKIWSPNLAALTKAPRGGRPKPDKGSKPDKPETGTAGSGQSKSNTGRYTIFTMVITNEGETRNDAINSILVEAVERVYGVAISRLYQDKQRDVNITKGNKRGVSEKAIAVRTTREDLVKFAAGYVLEYNVLKAKKIPSEGLVQVTAVVKVARYNPVGPKRSFQRTLAIVPFRTELNAFPFGSGQIPAANLSKTVNQYLFQHITKSRKFKVLDREFIRERVQEKDFIKRVAAPVELAHLHKELGADYLLVGEISEFGVLSRVRDVAGVAISTTTANMVLHYRLLELATGIVHDTAIVPVQIPADAVKQMMRQGGPKAVLRAQSDLSAANISGGILEILYPPKVIKSTQDSLVYLDSGGLRMVRGQTVQLFGPLLSTPAKGSARTIYGRPLGLAEVVDVFPEFVICRLLGNGSPINIPIGSIARGVYVQKAPATPVKKPRLKAGDLLGD